jgi:hypothetical protein
MKPTTIFIQFVCVGLGALFMFIGLFEAREVIVGGLLLGSVLFLFAAILGADHTTNSSPTSRQAFKVFTVVVALPILGIAALGLYRLLAAERWLDAITAFVQFGILLASILAIVFQDHSVVNRVIKRLGFSTPKQ